VESNRVPRVLSWLKTGRPEGSVAAPPPSANRAGRYVVNSVSYSRTDRQIAVERELMYI